MRQDLLAKMENENPEKAITDILDDHDIHLELHANINGLEEHIKEHEQMKNNPDVQLIQMAIGRIK